MRKYKFNKLLSIMISVVFFLMPVIVNSSAAYKYEYTFDAQEVYNSISENYKTLIKFDTKINDKDCTLNIKASKSKNDGEVYLNLYYKDGTKIEIRDDNSNFGFIMQNTFTQSGNFVVKFGENSLLIGDEDDTNDKDWLINLSGIDNISFPSVKPEGYGDDQTSETTETTERKIKKKNTTSEEEVVTEKTDDTETEVETETGKTEVNESEEVGESNSFTKKLVVILAVCSVLLLLSVIIFIIKKREKTDLISSKPENKKECNNKIHKINLKDFLNIFKRIKSEKIDSIETKLNKKTSEKKQSSKKKKKSEEPLRNIDVKSEKKSEEKTEVDAVSNSDDANNINTDILAALDSLRIGSYKPMNASCSIDLEGEIVSRFSVENNATNDENNLLCSRTSLQEPDIQNFDEYYKTSENDFFPKTSMGLFVKNNYDMLINSEEQPLFEVTKDINTDLILVDGKYIYINFRKYSGQYFCAYPNIPNLSKCFDIVDSSNRKVVPDSQKINTIKPCFAVCNNNSYRVEKKD